MQGANERSSRDEPLLLYSTNTWLAYSINERYYSGRHFVWCSPFFTADLAPLSVSSPPSSTPADICCCLIDDIRRGDRHSAKIASVRAGIRRGAKARRETGLITEQERLEIEDVVAVTGLDDFRPLLYVIPFHRVAATLGRVPPAERAHPCGDEFLLGDLQRGDFDVLQWKWR
jgi:hypothetical protein